ncbi:MAG: hypothetical protein U0800_24930 [Isosphaeraceae bacterium]
MRVVPQSWAAPLGLLFLATAPLLAGCANRSGVQQPDRVSLLPVPTDVPRVHVRGPFSPPRRNRGALLVTPVVPSPPGAVLVPEESGEPPAVGLGRPTPAFPD